MTQYTHGSASTAIGSDTLLPSARPLRDEKLIGEIKDALIELFDFEAS